MPIHSMYARFASCGGMPLRWSVGAMSLGLSLREELMNPDDRAKFENDLIHQRLTWLGTFEGLLFVANSYGKYPYLLPIVGFLIAFSIDVGIREANDALTKLDAQPPRSWRRSFMPGVAIPKIIAVTWLVILWRISG
jgi:hypothetical protein